jgi:mannose-1-phosphate guanylyltransferase
MPKQYCRILGNHSLLEATLLRIRNWIPRRRTLVVVTRSHLSIARDQLAQLPTGNVLVQPRNCDTGPGLLFSLLHLASKDPKAHVALFPSDHYVGNERVFIDHVRRATALLRRFPDKIILLGIRPDHCALGYGYVEPAHPLSLAPGAAAAFHVGAFQEKPDAEAADALLRRGGLWNSFVMVFRLQRLLELLQQEVPLEFAQMQAAFSEPTRAEDHYRDLAPWNFSRRFLSHVPQHLAVLPVEGAHWSDWGTPEAIQFTLQRLNQAPPSWARHLVPAAG